MATLTSSIFLSLMAAYCSKFHVSHGEPNRTGLFEPAAPCIVLTSSKNPIAKTWNALAMVHELARLGHNLHLASVYVLPENGAFLAWLGAERRIAV